MSKGKQSIKVVKGTTKVKTSKNSSKTKVSKGNPNRCPACGRFI